MAYKITGVGCWELPTGDKGNNQLSIHCGKIIYEFIVDNSHFDIIKDYVLNLKRFNDRIAEKVKKKFKDIIIQYNKTSINKKQATIDILEESTKKLEQLQVELDEIFKKIIDD